MTMLNTPKAIAKMAKMTIMAIRATIVMVIGNFSMAKWGIQLTSMNKLAQ